MVALVLKRTTSALPSIQFRNWWWDITYNTCGGCEYHTTGCLHCFAAARAGTLLQEAGAERRVEPLYDGIVDQVKSGDWIFNGNTTVLRPGHPEWLKPLRYPGAERPLLGPSKPSLIFVASMSELFLEGRPQDVIDRTLGTVAISKHIGQLCTKRPDRLAEYFLALDSRTAQRWKSKFWLGFSAERQQEFDWRWPHMRPLAERGWLVFVGIAPTIGPVTLPDDFLALGSWTIVSGEQGRHDRCRDMDPAWARVVRDQCRAAGVPFFLKQMARLAPIPPDLFVRQFPALRVI